MTGAPLRRLGFSTLGQPGITLDRVIELARRHAARGVELRIARGEVLEPGMTSAEAAAVGSVLADGGVTLLSLSSYVGLATASDGVVAGSDNDPVVADLRHHLTLAEAAHAGGVRVFMKDPEPRFDARPPGPPTAGEVRARARLHAVRDDLSRTGVRVLVETHDSHSTATSVASFLDMCGLGTADGVAVIWDTAHSWVHGEEPAESLAVLGDRLAHLQIKDIRSLADPTPVESGSGTYPIAALAEALRSADVAGWVVLEWERAWNPELSTLDHALHEVATWARPVFDERPSDHTEGAPS